MAHLPLITAAPQTLVLERGDLPAGFRVAGADAPDANRYSIVYLRPATLLSSPTSGYSLLGVIADVQIFPERAEATQEYEKHNAISVASIIEDIKRTTGTPTGVEVQFINVEVAGVDAHSVIRVQYSISSVSLIEHRYRMLVGNAVVTVIVTARATQVGVDPPNFAAQAKSIVERQIGRINSSRH
jgi:hypothetical protein